MRPKIWLCNDGNYREMRYFTAWQRRRVETYRLPDVIQKIQGQVETKIGDVIFDTRDASFTSETCEELWTPDSPHAQYSLLGVEIILNSSGSHHELRKLNTRVELILEATAKSGGVYMYANQRGCDGDRLYYDGSSMILSNGRILAQGSQFSLNEVEVLTSTVDLDDIWSSRTSRSRGAQSMEAPQYERIKVDYHLTRTEGVVKPLRHGYSQAPFPDVDWVRGTLKLCRISGCRGQMEPLRTVHIMVVKIARGPAAEGMRLCA